MRLDAVVAPAAAGLGLSAALLGPQSIGVVAFHVPGGGRRRLSPIGHGRCDGGSTYRHRARRPLHSFPSVDNCKSRCIGFGRVQTALSSRSSSDDFIDAIVEDKTAGLALDDEVNTSAKKRKRDIFKKALRDLASLSLVDYKWRSALFKKNEADRMEEEWMAAMMGEDASYARPMDADDERRGPLGNAEKNAVQWLTSVIEEEGKRARLIADSDGELIRPKDNAEGGPLSELERKAIQFLSEITDSEVERVRSGTIRPKDMENPGPLGDAEAKATLALDRIIESEKVRMDQSRRMGGEAVRPIDVPGPLGELERYVGDIIRAERQRVKDREANEGKLVRPMAGSMKSGLGEIERKAVEDLELLKKEEKERLFSLRRFLDERRPMEADKDSPLGVTEAFTVGLLRGPTMVKAVFGRVRELLASEGLEGDLDQEVLQTSLPESKSVDESPAQEKSNGPGSDEEDVTP